MRVVFLQSIFLLYSFFALAQVIQPEKVKCKNYLTLQVGYPIPFSGSTFNRLYDGVFDTRLGYLRTKNNISFGSDIGYCNFALSHQTVDFTGKMTVLSPGLIWGYKFISCKKIMIVALLKCGYDFIFFSGNDVEGNVKTPFHEGGISLLPTMSVKYSLNKNNSLGFCLSYEIIFQHFGDNSVYEESTIRIMDFGIKIIHQL